MFINVQTQFFGWGKCFGQEKLSGRENCLDQEKNVGQEKNLGQEKFQDIDLEDMDFLLCTLYVDRNYPDINYMRITTLLT